MLAHMNESIISPVTFHQKLSSGGYKVVNALLHVDKKHMPTEQDHEKDDDEVTI